MYHFGPSDADVFFGRDIYIQQLVDLVQKQNFIGVLGASGSGKSSVVLAGLVPVLAKAGHWKFTHFRPGDGDDPFHALAIALVPLYTPHLNETEQMVQALQLADFLRTGTLSLTTVIAKIKANYPQDRVLLIADQFEELYTLCADEAIRSQFLNSLIQSIQPPIAKTAYQRNTSFPLVFVLTMRADFLEQALSHRSFAEVLQSRSLFLGPMNWEELAEIIVKPAKNAGASLQDGLVERILNDIENQPGSLPLLEFALTLLWEERTDNLLAHSAYEAIGQVKGALVTHAEREFTALNEVEQEQARHIFLQLVQPGEGTEDTRRLALKLQVGADSWPLIKCLADARLVVTSRNGAGKETVEVAHEALIRSWKRLRHWIETDRTFLTWWKWLRFAVDQWEASKRDEGALLRGNLLTEAKSWLDQRGNDLGSTERDFIQASISLQEQEQRQKEEVRRNRLVLEIVSQGAEGRDLSGADLRGGYLRGRCLSGANLSEADLSEADLSEADLSEVNLSKAYLRGADLRGANLSEASLSGANLRNVQIDDRTQIDNKWRLVWEIVNQNGAGRSLRGVDLDQAYLSEADLSEADLSEADLRGADLRGANLSETDLHAADLRRGANLRGSDLRGANLRNVQIDDTTQIDNKWRLVWEIVNQRMVGRNLNGADLSEANLNEANLKGAEWD